MKSTTNPITNSGNSTLADPAALTVDPTAAPALADRFHAPIAGVSNEEKQEFEMRHARVKQGLKTFYEVGRELEIIRDKRLYRAWGFPTFDDYCRRELSMTARYASHLWVAADIVRELSENNCSYLPESESQARPLAALSREQWTSTWSEACRTAPEGKITAKHVQSVVSRYKTCGARPAPAIDVPPDRNQEKVNTALRAMAAMRELQAIMGTPASADVAKGMDDAVRLTERVFDDFRRAQEKRQ